MSVHVCGSGLGRSSKRSYAAAIRRAAHQVEHRIGAGAGRQGHFERSLVVQHRVRPLEKSSYFGFEARGTRKNAYQGRYEIKGNHIDYWDDTGFTADGKFVDKDTHPA